MAEENLGKCVATSEMATDPEWRNILSTTASSFTPVELESVANSEKLLTTCAGFMIAIVVNILSTWDLILACLYIHK